MKPQLAQSCLGRYRVPPRLYVNLPLAPPIRTALEVHPICNVMVPVNPTSTLIIEDI
jgi:hypothetical protein